jgi:hypothetical protein
MGEKVVQEEKVEENKDDVSKKYAEFHEGL